MKPWQAVDAMGVRRHRGDVVAADGLRWRVAVRCLAQLPDHVYAMTTFDPAGGVATIWLHREAWREVRLGTARTLFSVAHELGHVALHAETLIGLSTRPEPDHGAQLEAEANRFAAHLIVPDVARLELPPSELTQDALMRRFNVSAITASRRLAEWGIT